jgi:neurofibromin 1
MLVNLLHLLTCPNVTDVVCKKYPAAISDEEADEWMGTTSDGTDYIVLHRFFAKHADKIGKELLSLLKPSADGNPLAVSGKQAWDGLCALLVDLGPPMEAPRLSSSNSSEHSDYIDLMSRFAYRNTASVQDILIETSVPKVSVLAYLVE